MLRQPIPSRLLDLSNAAAIDATTTGTVATGTVPTGSANQTPEHGSRRTMPMTILTVRGWPGKKKPASALYQMIEPAVKMDWPEGSLSEKHQQAIRERLRHFGGSGHRLARDGLSLSIACIVFPMNLDERDIQTMYLPLTFPTRGSTNPILCKSEQSTRELLTAIYGNDRPLSNSTFASIASFVDKRVLCIVPCECKYEPEILACLDVEDIQTDEHGTMRKLFFHTKVVGGDESYTKSQCCVTRAMFRMWFPRKTCPDICGIEPHVYFKKTDVTSKRARTDTSLPAQGEKNAEEVRKSVDDLASAGGARLTEENINSAISFISNFLKISRDEVFEGLVNVDVRITNRIIGLVDGSTSNGRTIVHADILCSFAYAIMKQRFLDQYKSVKETIINSYHSIN